MKGDDIMSYCLNCGKELINRQIKYCSNKCQQEYQSKKKLQAWKDGTFNGVSGQYGLSEIIRNYLFEKNNNKCELCGWGEKNPFTNLIPLEVHHKDGNHENNLEENLQLLCPNCHSLTENFKSRGNDSRSKDRKKYQYTNKCIDCGKEIASTSTRCNNCEQKHRAEEFLKKIPISREELKKRIRNESFESIGKDYNISGNGLKRWISKYNLPNTKTLIKSYNDEEWEKL